MVELGVQLANNRKIKSVVPCKIVFTQVDKDTFRDLLYTLDVLGHYCNLYKVDGVEITRDGYTEDKEHVIVLYRGELVWESTTQQDKTIVYTCNKGPWTATLETSMEEVIEDHFRDL